MVSCFPYRGNYGTAIASTVTDQSVVCFELWLIRLFWSGD
jgi:hypothetical protein